MTFEEALRELGQREFGADGSVKSGAGRQLAPPLHAHTGTWVAATLRDLISDGKLAPGTKLSESALSEVLHVSRNTLREAFSTLGGEHIVIRIPNRGVYVVHPTADDIREIYRVRRFLEPAALMWCPTMNPNVANGGPKHDAANDAPDPADDTSESLQSIIARARSARDESSVAQMASANQDFHSAVVALTGSERLNTLMSQVLAEMRLVFHTMAADPEFHAPYVEDNARMLGLLESGSRGDAAELMSGYLDRAEEQLLAAMADRAA